MDLHLRDKHVFMTGDSKGIGLTCADAFLASTKAHDVIGICMSVDGAMNPIVV